MPFFVLSMALVGATLIFTDRYGPVDWPAVFAEVRGNWETLAGLAIFCLIFCLLVRWGFRCGDRATLRRQREQDRQP